MTPCALNRRSAGSSRAQRASALGHLVRNTQPNGGSIGDGISPIGGPATLARSSLEAGQQPEIMRDQHDRSAAISLPFA